MNPLGARLLTRQQRPGHHVQHRAHSALLPMEWVKTHSFHHPNICGSFTPLYPHGTDSLDDDEIDLHGRYVGALEVLREKDRHLFSQ